MYFNEIETERLHLKNIGTNDREFIFSMFSDDVVNKYLFDAEPLADLPEAQNEKHLHNKYSLYLAK